MIQIHSQHASDDVDMVGKHVMKFAIAVDRTQNIAEFWLRVELAEISNSD